jgi:hypothetical protein
MLIVIILIGLQQNYLARYQNSLMFINNSNGASVAEIITCESLLNKAN